MADIKNFYLNTPLGWYEYMRMKYDILPQEIIDKYEVDKLVTRDGHVYIEIQKGMYGLLQAGIMASKLLTERLEMYWYASCTHTLGLWRQKWQPISFALLVDNFGVKHTGKEHAQHLVSTLKDLYDATLD
eukprot:5515313-Ditylum_brightwellii.AAC.1